MKKKKIISLHKCICIHTYKYIYTIWVNRNMCINIDNIPSKVFVL